MAPCRCLKPNFRTFVLVLCIVYIAMLFVFQSGLEFRRDMHSNPWSSGKSVESQEGDESMEALQQDRIEIPEPPPCHGPEAKDPFKFKEVIGNLHVFSGYWDRRYNDFDNKDNRTYIRIMAVLLTTQKTGKGVSNCLFKVKGRDDMLLSPLNYYEMCENHGRRYGGFILSCLVPEEMTNQPCSVTLQSSENGHIKQVEVPVYSTERRPVTYKFGLCLSPLFGSVNQEKFIEFMEFSSMMGAERVTLYDMHHDTNLNTVLEHYKDAGMLLMVPWQLPPVVDAKVWYHGQLLAIQDCLYRNMATVDFLAFNDLDEFIMPREVFDWEDMIRAIHKPNHCGYTFKSAFFDPRQDSTFTGSQLLFTSVNNQRTKTFSKFRTKNMVIPHKVFEKGIHHISKPILANLEVPMVEPDIAFLHHYRSCMTGFGMNCREFTTDNHVSESYPELEKRVRHTCKKIGVRCR